MVKFFHFEKYHGKRNIGSTRIRVKNLLKHWPEADEYKFGDKAEVMIFQKVYVTGDTFRSSAFDFIKHYQGIKILDVCDPDWLGSSAWTKGCLIKQTVDNVDAVVVPTEPLAKFIRQLTDKPVKVIPDRFVIESFPPLKQHTGDVKKAVWFGYAHNAEILKYAMHFIEKNNIHLTVISNEDPRCNTWAEGEIQYTYKKWEQPTAYDIIRQNDIAILPKGIRVVDKYKSNNRAIQSWLCGVPVCETDADVGKYQDPIERNKAALERYNEYRKEYDVRKSVEQYKELIDEIRNTKAE